MDLEIQKLGEVLCLVDVLPWDYALYLLSNKRWDKDTRCAVLNPDEDSDFAKQRGLKHALSVADVQDIVTNAKMQKPDIDISNLIVAFLHYYDKAAFIEFLVQDE